MLEIWSSARVVLVHTAGTRNEYAQSTKHFWRRESGCSPGQRAETGQGAVVPGQAETLEAAHSCCWHRDESLSSAVTKVLWLRSKGRMPL